MLCSRVRDNRVQGQRAPGVAWEVAQQQSVAKGGREQSSGGERKEEHSGVKERMCVSEGAQVLCSRVTLQTLQDN